MNRASGYYQVQETFGDIEIALEVSIDDPLITVSILDVGSRIHARGSAKRVTDDDFNLNVGRTLATARALTRFGQRLEKVTLRATEHD